MSLLTGPEILLEMERGNIVIDPFDPKNLGPNSYDLTLSPHLKVYRKNLWIHEHWEKRHCPPSSEDWWKNYQPLDMAVKEETVDLFIPLGGRDLFSNVVYLGCTIEHTETMNFVPFLEGRSSVGRLGATSHVCAGFGDTGFAAPWTTEITIVYPLRVYSGIRFCQIVYSTTKGDIKNYDGKYQGQRGPQPSGLWRDFVKKE